MDEQEKDEISLLDLLLVLAENIKLLIFGPLLAGLVALLIGFTLQQTYVSQAVLLIPTGNTSNLPNAAQAASMMSSPLVLDPIITANSLAKDKSIQQVRLDLEEQIKAVVGKDGLLRLDVKAKSPKEAQDLGVAVIDTWLKTTLPSEQDRIDLEIRLAAAKEGYASVSGLLNKLSVDGAVTLSKPLTRGEAGTSLVALGELQVRYLNDVLSIPKSLKGLSRDVVKQAPTLPVDPISNKKALMAVLTALGAGFVLLLFVFARQAWRSGSSDSAVAEKQARLAAAFRGAK